MAYTKDKTVDSWDISKQLDYYKSNPTEAKQEIERANGVGGSAAANWASQLQSGLGSSSGSSSSGSTYVPNVGIPSSKPSSSGSSGSSYTTSLPSNLNFPSSSGSSSSGSSSSGSSSSGSSDPYSNLPSTGPMGYGRVPGTNYYSPNPGNPNAARFHTNGTPVASASYTDANNNYYSAQDLAPDKMELLKNLTKTGGDPSSLYKNWIDQGIMQKGTNPFYTTGGGSSSGGGGGGGGGGSSGGGGGSYGGGGNSGGYNTGVNSGSDMARINQMLDAIYAAKPGTATYTPGVGNTFSMDDLKGLMTGVNGSAGTAKYQTPEGIGGLINQMNGLLTPLSNQQKATANTSYNGAMQNLKDQWASRGMLASGGAAAKEQEGANALSQQMSGIDAQQQANAIPLAFQSANLGLQEQNQLFGQKQQGVNNMLSALGQQTGMQQADFNKWATQQQLNNNNNNNWTNNVLAGTAQATGNQQFNSNLAQRQADQSQQNNQFQQNLNNQQSQWQQTFNNTLNQQQQASNQWQQQFDQGIKQGNISNALNLSQLTGQLYQPKSGGAELFGQQPLGPTASTQNSLLQAILGAAGNYPQIPNGTGDAIGNMGGIYSQLAQYFTGLQGKTTNQGVNSQIAQQNANNSKVSTGISQGNLDLSNKKYQGSMATQGHIADILANAKNRDQAISYLQKYGNQIVNDGGDLASIKAFVDQQFPDPSKQKMPVDPSAVTQVDRQKATKWLTDNDMSFTDANPQEQAQKVQNLIQFWKTGQPQQ